MCDTGNEDNDVPFLSNETILALAEFYQSKESTKFEENWVRFYKMLTRYLSQYGLMF